MRLRRRCWCYRRCRRYRPCRRFRRAGASVAAAPRVAALAAWRPGSGVAGVDRVAAAPAVVVHEGLEDAGIAPETARQEDHGSPGHGSLLSK